MAEEERVFSRKKKAEDQIDYTFRPRTLSQFIGQDKIKENLKVYIEAAKSRNEPLDHILFYGPPGLGKTTLAHVIAKEMGVNVKAIQAPMLEKTGDIAAYLTGLSQFDIFFIDEIHRLRVAIEEVLYSAMEDFKLDIIIGQGAGAKSVKINLPRFTLIGATTKAGLLTAPLRTRFGIVDRLELYEPEILKEIVLRSAKLMKLDIDDDSASEIALRSRGTPRVVNRIMRRIRDFAQVIGNGIVSIDITKSALNKLDIDEIGLDAMDRRLLKTIIDHYNGGPVGVETLAVSVGETIDTIEDVYEPYLIQQGFIKRTPRGRVTTSKCYEYFGLTNPSDQNSLFF